MPWPKGKSRKPQAEPSSEQAAPATVRKMKKLTPDAGSDSGNKYAKFRAKADARWQDYSGENRLEIDPDILVDLERDGLLAGLGC